MGRRVAVTFVALLAVAACENAPPESGPEFSVVVSDATVQLPAVPGRPGAAYFTLRTTNDPTRLVSVGSPGLGRVELHGSMTMKGMATMAPLSGGQLVFDPGKPLVFAPGGKHAMIFDMPVTLKPGARIPLTFTLEPAGKVTVWADVRATGRAAGDMR